MKAKMGQKRMNEEECRTKEHAEVRLGHFDPWWIDMVGTTLNALLFIYINKTFLSFRTKKKEEINAYSHSLCLKKRARESERESLASSPSNPIVSEWRVWVQSRS